MNLNAPEMLYDSIEYVELTSQRKPILMVVIDTEEEFPWDKPHTRSNVSTSAIKNLDKVQNIFDSYGIIPCYVIDYPVASDRCNNTMLKEISDDGRCIIGAHLHPWVTPPHVEAVNNFNSFPGNLPKETEFNKLLTLKKEIERNFEVKVNTYKAGRYGVGSNTAHCLAELDINIDLSPTPGFNYASSDGPDYSGYTNKPFRFGNSHKQLCIPCTGDLIGWAKGKPKLYKYINSTFLLSLRAPGIAARLGAIERIRLSPEGYTLDEMKKLTRSLLNAGEKIFTLSFHSPSVKPGCTPYVNSEEELSRFLKQIDEYLAYFSEEVGGEFMHAEQLSKII